MDESTFEKMTDFCDKWSGFIESKIFKEFDHGTGRGLIDLRGFPTPEFQEKYATKWVGDEEFNSNICYLIIVFEDDKMQVCYDTLDEDDNDENIQSEYDIPEEFKEMATELIRY